MDFQVLKVDLKKLKISFHSPDYDAPAQISANIALIYLEDAAPEWMNFDLNYVALPQPEDAEIDFENFESFATGFGVTSDAPGTGTSVILQYVNMRVIANEECEATYGNVITEYKICTDTTGGRSTCAGDEGAPLVVYAEPDRRIILGVGSFRSGDGCTVGHPGERKFWKFSGF